MSCSLSSGSVEEPGLGGRATATRPDFMSTPTTGLILDRHDPQRVSVSNMKNVGRRLQALITEGDNWSLVTSYMKMLRL